jgi:hypothetical protein
MANITYQRAYQHQDWIDGADVVQASGPRGFNAEFHALEAEFDSVSGAISVLSGSLGAFQPLGASKGVAYGGGNVGIGSSFSAAAPPVYRLDLDLGPNTDPTQQVRFGNAVCCSGGVGAFAGYAVFSHKSHASDTDFALRQGPNGDVDLNASLGRAVRIRQNGASIRLGVSPGGNVVVGSDTDLPGAPAGAALQVAGEAFKLAGSSAWLVPSDARLKENVRDLEAGLDHLRRVRPVRFRYNGRAGTPAGREGIGVLGQEIELVLPETVQRSPGGSCEDPELEGIRIFDGSALTFVLINAVKELADKVERLEQALAKAGIQLEPEGIVACQSREL